MFMCGLPAEGSFFGPGKFGRMIKGVHINAHGGGILRIGGYLLLVW